MEFMAGGEVAGEKGLGSLHRAEPLTALPGSEKEPYSAPAPTLSPGPGEGR